MMAIVMALPTVHPNVCHPAARAGQSWNGKGESQLLCCGMAADRTHTDRRSQPADIRHLTVPAAEVHATR